MEEKIDDLRRTYELLKQIFEDAYFVKSQKFRDRRTDDSKVDGEVRNRR